MKDKNVAAIFALFLGWAGVHRFYLGQIFLGIVYVLLMGTGISFILGLIDAIAFFAMDEKNFNFKHNRKYYTLEDQDERNRDWRERRAARERQRNQPQQQRQRPNQRPQPSSRQNPHKQKGIEYFKDFDYRAAVEEFNKAIQLDPKDVTIHFNLACAYSLLEEADKAFHHLDKAVEYGFRDFDRIRKHDALAYLRIQDKFESFADNNFRLPPDAPQTKAKQPAEDKLILEKPDLLEQLNKLAELRDKGLLSEEEFNDQKRLLMD